MVSSARLRSWGRRVGVVAAVWVVACGGDPDPVGPGDDPALAPFVGSWSALAMEVSSLADPSTVAHPLDLGATFHLNVQPSGQYTATLVFAQQTSTEIGFLSVSGSTVTMTREFPTRSTSTATYEFRGGLLILDGDTEYDFNGDLQPEAARAHIELQKS